MPPLPCLLAVSLPVERGCAVTARAAIVALAPLSSPLCLAFLPIALWRIVRHVRHRALLMDAVVPLVYLAASAAQIAVIVTSKHTSQSSPPLGRFSGGVARLYGTEVTAPLLFGIRVSQSIWEVTGAGLAAISAAVVAAALIWRVWRSGAPARWVISILVAASGAVFLIEWRARAFEIPRDMSRFSFPASRFDVFPTLLLIFALLVPLDLAWAKRAPRGGARLADDLRRSSLILVVLSAWVAVAIVPSYHGSVEPDFVQTVEAAERACERLPITDHRVQIAPKRWFIFLSCKELARAD